MTSSEEQISWLKKLLADTYCLYLKTQNYHWNVTGMHFYGLHKMFEEQYEALAEAVDEMAERIRTVGGQAPGSFEEFAQLKSLAEAKSSIDASTMIEDLVTSHQQMVKRIYEALAVIKDDEATIDFLVERLQEHEKTAWMLKAHLA